MWAWARRSGLFVMAYAPLAAILAALKWPTGWSESELQLLGVWLAGVALLLVLPLAASFLPAGPGSKAVLIVGAAGAVAVIVAGLRSGWAEPMALDAPAGHSSAGPSGIAFAFCVAAFVLAMIIVLDLRRPATDHWVITDPGESDSWADAVAMTYIAPLVGLDAEGWRLWAIYGGYPLAVYVLVVTSSKMILANATLRLFGVRIFDVLLSDLDTGRSKTVLLLGRGSISQTMKVDVIPLGDDCFIATHIEAEDPDAVPEPRSRWRRLLRRPRRRRLSEG